MNEVRVETVGFGKPKWKLASGGHRKELGGREGRESKVFLLLSLYILHYFRIYQAKNVGSTYSE